MLVPGSKPLAASEGTLEVKHIIEDRYASIYSQVMPDYRVGPSCPVTFNTRLQASKWWNRRGAYQARVIREASDGRRYVYLVQRPSEHDEIDVIEAGQYNNYCPPILG